MTTPRRLIAAEKRDDDAQTFISTLPMVRLILGAPAVTIFLSALYKSYNMIGEYIQNPNRHLYEVAVGIPVLSVVEFVVASQAQIISYIVLILYALVLFRWMGRAPLLLMLLVTPLLGILAWYGYDHFVPDYRWYTDESPPYEHGLTLGRFAKAWACEIAVAFGYWWLLRKKHASYSLPS